MTVRTDKVTVPAPIEYRAIGSIRGPLIVVEDVAGVAWDEVAEIRLDSGEVRHGTVLDVHDDLAVLEILEGTAGMRLDSARVAFSGAPMQIPVGEGWLGRTCNGRGEPIDGGPPVLAGERRPVAGAPINPARRAAPSEAILTGVSAIDGMATLVRGQKLPAACRIWNSPRRSQPRRMSRASHSRSCSRRWACRTRTCTSCAACSSVALISLTWRCSSTPPRTRSSSGSRPPGSR
jgi:hypothetical protein